MSAAPTQLPKGSTEMIQEEEDLLGINKLSVDYNYLLYKIQDYVESIQLQTSKICARENQLIVQDIVGDIVDPNIEQFKELLRKCDELEQHFDMLEQIEMISLSFKDRLRVASNELVEIRRDRLDKKRKLFRK